MLFLQTQIDRLLYNSSPSLSPRCTPASQTALGCTFAGVERRRFDQSSWRSAQVYLIISAAAVERWASTD